MSDVAEPPSDIEWKGKRLTTQQECTEKRMTAMQKRMAAQKKREELRKIRNQKEGERHRKKKIAETEAKVAFAAEAKVKEELNFINNIWD